MLKFDEKLHDAIREGRITVTFRDWERPPVSGGRRYHSGALGDVMLEEVSAVPLSEVTPEDARAAGAESLEAWRGSYLAQHPKVHPDRDHTYRVRFRYMGNDAERVRLGQLGEDDLRRLDRELVSIDVKSYEGEWTQLFIAVLTQKKWMRPGDIAQQVGADHDMVRRKMGILVELGIVRADPGLGYALSDGGRKLYAYRMRA
jgi:hypothetical protein